jgi:CBS domain-containing protein
MTTEVLSFHPGDNVGDAMTGLVDRGVDAAPVIDEAGRVVGIISTGDLIVQEVELHAPTVISLLGATLELPSSKRHFEEDLRRALGATVADVMTPDPVTIAPSATVEDAATTMHTENVSRLPVVDDGVLVGIVARTDILRSIIRDDASDEA